MNKEMKLPADYGFTRIGSAINYHNRELFPTLYAFDMGKLNGMSLLTSKSPRVRISTSASTYHSRKESAWSTSIDTKIKNKFLICNTELGFHADLSAGEMTGASGLKLEVSYIEEGYEISLANNATAEQLYQCATPKFQSYYKAIADATTPETWLLAYQEFHELFGHGFVNNLQLISYASGTIEFNYTSKYQSDNQKYGGSFSASGIGTSISASAEYAKSLKESGATGELRAEAFGHPSISPAFTWVSGVISNYMGKGVDTLLKSPPENMALPGTTAKAPDLPFVTPPKKIDILPDAKINISTGKELINYLKIKSHLAEKGATIASLEDYMKIDEKNRLQMQREADASINSALKSANCSNIIQESLSVIQRKRSKSTGDLNKNQERETTEQHVNAKPITTETSGVSEFNPGAYTICGFDFKKYEDFFPDLKLNTNLIGSAGIHLIKHQLFVMVQQMFMQYLNYVKELPEALRGDAISSAVALRFCEFLKNYNESSRSFIKNKLANGKAFTIDDYEILRTDFFSRLHKESWEIDFPTIPYHGLKPIAPNDEKKDDGSYKNYDKSDPRLYKINLFFLENYDALSKAPFGYALNISNDGIPFGKSFPTKHYYLTRNDNSPFLLKGYPFPQDTIPELTTGVTSQLCAENCHRFMPIIRVAGERIFFVMATYISNLYDGTDHFSGQGLKYIPSPGLAQTKTEGVLNSTGGWAVVASLSASSTWATYTVAPIITSASLRFNTAMVELQLYKPLPTDDDVISINMPDGYCASGATFIVDEPGVPGSTVSMSRLERTYNGKTGLRCDIGFLPVGYKTVQGYKVRGIPMWSEFPLEEFEQAANNVN